MRFVYGYRMVDAPERVRVVAPDHAAYWRRLALGGYLGGPFADRRGGLITFESESRDRAEGLVEEDPFRREGLVESHWLQEWLVE